MMSRTTAGRLFAWLTTLSTLFMFASLFLSVWQVSWQWLLTGILMLPVTTLGYSLMQRVDPK
mgnify:CR=1 FL=1